MRRRLESGREGSVVVRRGPFPGVDSTRIVGDGRLWTGYSTHYGLMVLEAGAFDFWYRGREWTLAPGHVKRKQPDEVHRDLRVHGAVTAHALAFAPAWVEEAARSLGVRGAPSFGDAVSPPGSEVQRAAWRLHRALSDGPVSLLEGEALAVDAVAAALRASGGSAPERRRVGGRRAVRRARELLHASLDQNLGLEALAEAADMDRFTLLRAFREELGLPPHAYLTHLRIARAQSLLAAGAPVVEVAQALGFCDQSQLHRHFRRIVGVPPGAYARALGSARQ